MFIAWVAVALVVQPPGRMVDDVKVKGWLGPRPDLQGKTVLIYTSRVADAAIELLATVKPAALLTPEPQKAAARFAATHRLTLPIGYGLSDLRRLRITRLPLVVTISAPASRPANVPIPPELLHGSSFDRAEALKRLADREDVDRFLAICDELLTLPPPPNCDRHFVTRSMWYGDIAYLRHLADPAVVAKQPKPLAEQLALSMDPLTSAAVTVYKAQLASKSTEELNDDYTVRRNSVDPVDVAIRLAIGAEVEKREPGFVKSFLLEQLPHEPDAYLRWLMVGGLGYLLQRNDSPALRGEILAAVSRFLEEEPDVRRVRPIMQELINHLLELPD